MKRGILAIVFASLAAVGGATSVAANDAACVQRCRAADNQCRIATKGSPQCDAKLQSCMDRCRRR